MMDTFMTVLVFVFVLIVLVFFFIEVFSLVRDLKKRKLAKLKKMEGEENEPVNEDEKD